MNEKERHFDEENDQKVSDKLTADLKALFKPQLKVPPEVDRAVMDKASQHLVRRRPKRILHWAGSVAAVAAIVMVVAILNFTQRPALHKARESDKERKFAEKPPEEERYAMEMPSVPVDKFEREPVAGVAGKLAEDNVKDSRSLFFRPALTVARADFDHSGRVDILDAFKLAKRIESTEKLDTKLDMNGDGHINSNDVDCVAYTAVRLDMRSGSGLQDALLR